MHQVTHQLRNAGYSERKLRESDGRLDRDATDTVLDEINERAWRRPCS